MLSIRLQFVAGGVLDFVAPRLKLPVIRQQHFP
jgi:hypothetical protein